ncbi:MAG: hypothetical protein U9R41_05150 [Candidatus Marinimicrobia bacterium]|nr:hypothetical protein [Candidatus Neomarinimicrobiota bacterium]
MINREDIKQLFMEELEDQNISIPDNVNTNDLVNHFIKFIEFDIYDWFHSNFNDYINDLILSDWENVKGNRQ